MSDQTELLLFLIFSFFSSFSMDLLDTSFKDQEMWFGSPRDKLWRKERF